MDANQETHLERNVDKSTFTEKSDLPEVRLAIHIVLLEIYEETK